MKSFFSSLLIIVSLFSILFSSCKKENQTPEDPELTSVEESTIAGDAFFDTFADLSTLSTENDLMFGLSAVGFQSSIIPAALSNSCGVVSISMTDGTWPKTMTLDFGTGLTAENVTRKGKIIAVFTDRFKNPGAKITVTFENFQVNDHKIEGTKRITNKGKNAFGNINYTVEISKSKISTIDKTLTFSTVNNIEWVKGFATSTHLDDVFSITGSANGTNSNGKDFSVNIVKPLIKKVAYPFFVVGNANINSGSGATRTLDYGSGDFDDKATLTVLGISKEITLPK